MKEEQFTFTDPEGTEIFYYQWLPVEGEVRAVIQLAHGMAEHAGRYRRFAEALTAHGYIVYANDHRGHGRTAKTEDNYGVIGQDGFNWMVKNMHQLTTIIKNENPNLPLFLFGHSMGSMLLTRYLSLYGHELKGAILSGSDGKPGFMLNLGILLAKQEVKKHGARHRSETINKMVFGKFNQAIKNARTPFDWLSRDPEEVDKYINDPMCGAVFPASFFKDFFSGIKERLNKEYVEQIPKSLPIYIFSGDKDPVGQNGKGIVNLVNIFKKARITDVSFKLYHEGRHEMLNEINRDQVTNDILHWLKAHH